MPKRDDCSSERRPSQTHCLFVQITVPVHRSQSVSPRTETTFNSSKLHAPRYYARPDKGRTDDETVSVGVSRGSDHLGQGRAPQLLRGKSDTRMRAWTLAWAGKLDEIIVRQLCRCCIALLRVPGAGESGAEGSRGMTVKLIEAARPGCAYRMPLPNIRTVHHAIRDSNNINARAPHSQPTYLTDFG